MRAKILISVLIVMSVVACQTQDFASIRDVRPKTLQQDDIGVVELEKTVTLQPNVNTRIVFYVEGHDPVAVAARVASGQRILFQVNDVQSSILQGLVHATIAVEQQQDNDYKTIADTSGYAYALRWFPKTLRGLATGLVSNKEQQALFDWLGMTVDMTQTGLSVTWLQQGFDGVDFIQRYDCGRWYDGRCVHGPDALVHRDEAQHGGYLDVETFDYIDANDDAVLDRYEATDANSKPSLAASAGVELGDIIVSVNGINTLTSESFLSTWNDAVGPSTTVGLLRQGTPTKVSLSRHGQPAAMPSGFLFAGVAVGAGLLLMMLIPVLGGLIVVWERKVAGRIQSRPGPNRVGPNGWLQWLADGIKLILKEDLIPNDSDSLLFRIAPFLVFTGVFTTFVVLPFSPIIQFADLNIGVLYILSVTSLVVVGVIMGGWASNSKWSLLGGMRSAAQIISYELPASLAILVVVVSVGSLSTQDIVIAQGGAPWAWHLFSNPFAFVCFFIFFISALAEGNRTPFDLAEAESELVSGYNTEYSGFRFSIFALAEWINLVVLGAVVSFVFLGGWNIPGVSPETMFDNVWFGLLGFMLFVLKTMGLIFLCIWIRWTMPRFRVDHMMNMCWKYFMPISLLSLLGAAGWVWFLPALAQEIVSWILFLGCGVLPVLLFIRRVLHNKRFSVTDTLRGA